MPTPLQWDARRDWTFDIGMDGADVALLRDHVTLITDLAKDWSSGATGDYHHFVPCDYQFRVNMTSYSVKLYVNDFNIVDTPNNPDDNCKPPSHYCDSEREADEYDQASLTSEASKCMQKSRCP